MGRREGREGHMRAAESKKARQPQKASCLILKAPHTDIRKRSLREVRKANVDDASFRNSREMNFTQRNKKYRDEVVQLF